MKNRNYFSIVLIIIIALGVFLFKNKNSASVSTGEKAYRDISHVILTKHAKCRMECRHINLQEIKEIIHDGNVNSSKSGTGSKGDATFALEGYSNEHQHLRVVVAPESDGLVVITCIDLDNEWPCNCN